MYKIKVNEIFKSIQGEGRYQGSPALFVRLSGCNRKCSFCDTKRHTENVIMTPRTLSSRILKELGSSTTVPVIFTGGEPLLQSQGLIEVISSLPDSIKVHLETNGDLIVDKKKKAFLMMIDYICCSLKEGSKIQPIKEDLDFCSYITVQEYDIKVVTDGKELNKSLIPYATMLMPLTTNDPKTNQEIRQRVWNMCVKKNLFYSGRLHVEVWGQTKGK